MNVTAVIWHMDPTDPNIALLEGEDGRIEVERTDHDEIALHFMCGDDEQSISSIYFNGNGALALAGILQAVAHTPFALTPRADISRAS